MAEFKSAIQKVFQFSFPTVCKLVRKPRKGSFKCVLSGFVCVKNKRVVLYQQVFGLTAVEEDQSAANFNFKNYIFNLLNYNPQIEGNFKK